MSAKSAKEDCIRPLEEIFSPEEIEQWGMQSIRSCTPQLPMGRTSLCFSAGRGHAGSSPGSRSCGLSSRYLGRGIAALLYEIPTALSLAGPHALLTFYSICLALGEEPDSVELVSDVVALAALDMMRALTANAQGEARRSIRSRSSRRSPNRSGIAFVPLVFGYVNYAAPSSWRRRVF